MTKHWDTFGGEKKNRSYHPPSEKCQNRYLHVFCIVISSAELVFRGQMRLYSTGAFPDFMACLRVLLQTEICRAGSWSSFDSLVNDYFVPYKEAG